MDFRSRTRSQKQIMCNTCLSRNRGLYLASKVPELKQLFPDIKFGPFDKVCWECKTMSKKYIAFRKRAYKAQKLLRVMIRKKEDLNTVQSLSLLKSAGPYTTSYGDLVLELPILTIKTDPLIKCEPEEILPIGEDMTIVKEETIDVEFEMEDIDNNLQETKQNIIGDIPAIEGEDCISNNKTHFNIWDNIILTNKNISDPSTSEKIPFDNEECKIKPDISESDINIGSNIEANNVTNIGMETSENHELNLSSKEKRFIVTKMTDEEMYKTREFDRNVPRYKSYTYKCDSCIIGYYTEDRYKKHLEEKHSKKVGDHKCPICDVNFSSLEESIQHQESHFKSYKCKHCDFTNHKISTMLIHMTKEHEREKKYTCKMCGILFDLPGSLRYHRDTVHRKLPRCFICGTRFTTSAALDLHNSLKHRASLPPLTSSPTPDKQCLHQGAPAPPADTLQPTHRAEGALKFKCTRCNEKFMNKPSMQRHISSKHLKQYPFSCEVCKKPFVTRYRLKAHMLEEHENMPRPKDKVCSYCGKGFCNRASLEAHIRTHTGERPFQCDQCMSSFTQASSLKSHFKAKHLNNKV